MTNSDKDFFLIDAYAMIFIYYALIRNPRLTSKGFDTLSAISDLPIFN